MCLVGTQYLQKNSMALQNISYAYFRQELFISINFNIFFIYKNIVYKNHEAQIAQTLTKIPPPGSK